MGGEDQPRHALSDFAGHADQRLYLFRGEQSRGEIFQHHTLPLLPENQPLAKAAGGVHEALSWAVYVLIGAHVAATAYHLIVKRDGVLNRMLPTQINAG